MTIDMTRFYEVFFAETAEHLADLEGMLVGLDLAAPDEEALNAIFRAAHSIKGGAATFGFTEMADLTHVMESLLDRVRKHQVPITAVMVDVLLAAGDVLKAQLAARSTGRGAGEDLAAAVMYRLQQLAAGQGGGAIELALQPTAPAAAPPAAASTAAGERLEICLQPGCSGWNARLSVPGLLEELSRFGPVQVLEQPFADPVSVTVPDVVLWRLGLETAASPAEIGSTLDFALQPDQYTLRRVCLNEDPGYGLFDDLPAASSQATADPGFGFFDDAPGVPTAAPEEAGMPVAPEGFGFFDGAPGAPQPTAEAATTFPPNGAADVAAVPDNRKGVDKATVSAEFASIRVAVEKVDHLLNLVGELVITQAMLAQTAEMLDPSGFARLHAGVAQLERNSRDLQEAVMAVRMMPIGVVFSRFPRLVRDLATRMGKDIELKMVGEGTELDRGLIEKIADPLTHLVRNSLDHGIELPDARQAAGKPPRGIVLLSAFHQGGNIVIEVEDDGRGLQREKILAKAAERGLAAHDGMSDQEVFALIFEPGFSTADEVTEVSGRGVGMDVVRRNIQGMGGSVDIDSIPGRGTRITIRLPLTLAILDGISIAVGTETYILPLAFVIESIQPRRQDLKSVGGEALLVKVRDQYLPVIRLHQVFGLQTAITDPARGILVVLDAHGEQAALLVDDLLGQQQVVIKSLETNYRKVSGFSGATILGDGRVAFILDAAMLAKMARQAVRGNSSRVAEGVT